MARDGWPYFDPEYETLSLRINPPRVSIDNSSCKECTVVKVDSVNKPGILLEMVQILSDLDLVITKAYVSSDGVWFMDEFHVTDQQGNKIIDSSTCEYLEKALGPKGQKEDVLKAWQWKQVGVHSIGDHTAIELIGRDRPGLLSEISAVLASHNFNVFGAEVWTHNRRIACVLYVNDESACLPLDNQSRLSAMQDKLTKILYGCEDGTNVAHTNFSADVTHVDRRLHQMMFADRDYEGEFLSSDTEYDPSCAPKITIDRCVEKGYSVVSVNCKDRTKLMFDIVCTLTDMQYVVFHATISSGGPNASQEYYIRHMDGCTLDSEAEKKRVIKCLEAAIRRRVSEDVRLEVCANDRVGLLSEVTRVLRENGLSVSRAGVKTIGKKGINVFYVRDASGNPVDINAIEGLRKEIGETMMLDVKKAAPANTKAPETSRWSKTSFPFGSLLERFMS